MTNTSKRSYKINIKKPVYCILTSDTSEGTTYGDVKSLGEAQQAQVTAVSSTGQLYGDGAIVDSSSKITGLTVVLSTTKIPVEAIADIYNYTVTNGVVQIQAGQQANYIAVGYEVEQTTGDSEYIWLLKGRPQPLNSDVQQSEQNVNYSTDQMTIDFVKRIYDDMLEYYADAANADFTASQAAAWFTQGPSSIVTPTPVITT